MKSLGKYFGFVVLLMGTAVVLEIRGVRIPTAYSLIVFLSAIIGDFLTTYACLKKAGTEGNPVIAFLFKKIKITGTFILMGCLWAVLIIYRWLPSPTTSQTAVAFAYMWVPLNNLVVFFKLNKRSEMQKLNKVTI